MEIKFYSLKWVVKLPWVGKCATVTKKVENHSPISTRLFEDFVRLGDGKYPRFLLAYISTITSAKIVIQVCIKSEFHTF